MAFTFKLEHADGTPAEPPTLHTAVPNWHLATRSRWAPTGRCASLRSGLGRMRTCSWWSPPREAGRRGRTLGRAAKRFPALGEGRLTRSPMHRAGQPSTERVMVSTLVCRRFGAGEESSYTGWP